MENIPVVKTDATEKPGSESASTTDNKGTTEPAKGTSSPDDKGSSQDAERGNVPTSRLNEVIGQRNVERQKREELERKVRDLESRFSAPAPVQQGGGDTDEIFTNPNGVIDKRVNPRMSAVEQQLNNIEAQNMESSLRSDYESNPVLQKMYGSYGEMAYALDTYASQIGFNKVLTPRERRLVYSNFIEAKKGDMINVAMDLGREEEKKRREIIPTTSDVAGSNVVPVKGKEISLSKEEMAFMDKIGLTKEAYKAFMEKAEIKGTKTSVKHPDL